jgi:hypothetical protein
MPNSRERGRCFPFYKWIIESGIWQNLKPTAQALYPVMRCFAFFDSDLFFELDELSIDDVVGAECYKNREFEYCNAEKDILAAYAGITLPSLQSALDSLEENYLIEAIEGNDMWRVYLKSKDMTSFKREYLNNKIIGLNRKDNKKVPTK